MCVCVFIICVACFCIACWFAGIPVCAMICAVGCVPYRSETRDVCFSFTFIWSTEGQPAGWPTDEGQKRLRSSDSSRTLGHRSRSVYSSYTASTNLDSSLASNIQKLFSEKIDWQQIYVCIVSTSIALYKSISVRFNSMTCITYMCANLRFIYHDRISFFSLYAE